MALQSCAKHQHHHHCMALHMAETHDLPIQKVLSPNYYNCNTTTVAITAPYSLNSNQSDFALLLPAKQCIPTKLTVITCSLQTHRPPNILMMTELPPSMATGMPTNPLQQDWYYIPRYQQEHHLTDLLPFHWYIHIKPPQSTATLHNSTDYSIQHSTTLLYSMVQVAPTLTAITMKAYLLALATKFRIGHRSWITWTYGKHHTGTPLPATPDKNLL